MKKLIYISVIISFMLGFMAMPSFALSDNAERFLRSCRALDSEFPPTNWDKYDLRDAAIEVLNEIENGQYERWAIDFCLKTLGYTQFPEDAERILKYEDEMIYSVLRSLRGFPTEDAINCHLRWIDNKIGPKRELAIQGLAEIDFNKLKDGEKWHGIILTELSKARSREKENWLIKEIDEATVKVKAAKPRPKTN
ncbi:hypothetical protein KKB99_07455 [bacterium]|nr:hypothetical protein [bacterium]MBU1025828.1 hypothetical protein [bacterium]